MAVDPKLIEVLTQMDYPLPRGAKLYPNGTISTEGIPAEAANQISVGYGYSIFQPRGRSEIKTMVLTNTIGRKDKLKWSKATDMMREGLLEEPIDTIENILQRESIKEYLIYNSDLNMSKGKLCAQLCHVQHIISTEMFKHPRDIYTQWMDNGMCKICLKAKQSDLEKIAELEGAIVNYDAGCTEVPPGSLTVVGFLPQYVRNAPAEIKNL